MCAEIVGALVTPSEPITVGNLRWSGVAELLQVERFAESRRSGTRSTVTDLVPAPLAAHLAETHELRRTALEQVHHALLGAWDQASLTDLPMTFGALAILNAYIPRTTGRIVNDFARTGMEAAEAVLEDPDRRASWMVHNAVQNLVVAGGQQSLYHLWLNLLTDPSAKMTEDSEIIDAFLRGTRYTSFPSSTAWERRTAVDDMDTTARALLAATSAFRKHIRRFIADDPAWVFAVTDHEDMRGWTRVAMAIFGGRQVGYGRYVGFLPRFVARALPISDQSVALPRDTDSTGPLARMHQWAIEHSDERDRRASGVIAAGGYESTRDDEDLIWRYAHRRR